MVIQQHLCLSQFLNSKNKWTSWCKSGPDFCGPGSALATPSSQELLGRAAVYLHAEVASGLYIPDSKERPQQRPVSLYRHSLKASARMKACVPEPPPTHSSLTTGRLCCSSFRRIQSFNSTRRLEAEYTRKGREEHCSYGMHGKQTKLGLLPFPPGGGEGRWAARRADSSHKLPAYAARHEKNKESGERPREHPPEGTPPAPQPGAVRPAPARPVPPRRPRCPPTQLRQRVGVREATCEGRRAATSQHPARGEGPRSPLGPIPPHPPGQVPERGPGPGPDPGPGGRDEGPAAPLPHLAAGRKGPARCPPTGPWRPGAASRTPGSAGTAGAAAPPGRRRGQGLRPPPPP